MAIAYDASTNGGGSTSYSHTCTGTNLVLLVSVGVLTGTTPTVTYNSVSMTQLTSTATALGITYFTFYLLGPNTGSNTIALSSTGAGCDSVAVSYTGVSQSGFPDSFSNTAGGLTASPVVGTTTVVASNCWLVGFGWVYSNDGTGVITDDRTSRKSASTFLAPNGKYDACDSNGTVGTGSQSTSFTVSGGTVFRGNCTVVSIAPLVVASSKLALLGVG